MLPKTAYYDFEQLLCSGLLLSEKNRRNFAKKSVRPFCLHALASIWISQKLNRHKVTRGHNAHIKKASHKNVNLDGKPRRYL